MMPRLLILLLLLLANSLLFAAEIRIPDNAPRPVSVGIAVFVNRISKVDDQNGTFDATIETQIRWKDTQLAFDPLNMGTNRLEFRGDEAKEKLTSIWNPALTLAGVNIHNQEQGLFIYADGTMIMIQQTEGVFETHYQLNGFPFDTQALSVNIVSKHYNANQIVLTQTQQDIDSSGLSHNIHISAWQPQRLKFVASTMQGWDGQSYPKMQAQILLSRLPFSHLLVLLMPFFLIMLIPTISSFCISMSFDTRLDFWTSSVLTLVALSFTYATRYPALPADNLTTHLIVIGVGYQTLMILLTATLFNPKVTESWFANKAIVPEIILYLRWAIPLALIGLVSTRVMLTALL